VDFSPDLRPDSIEVDPVHGSLRRYTLARADLVIIQTETQRKLLYDRFGRDGAILRSPIDLSGGPPLDVETPACGKIALWIGKSDKIKRPEILLWLASAFPQVDFMMVLNRSDPDIHAAILREKPSNVRVVEWVPFPETEKLFARAFVLINTSLFEGFPNTFLEAGKYGVPLLSFEIDPEGFIEKHSCGITAQGNLDRFTKGLDRLRSDHDLYGRFSRNVRKYVEDHHALDHKIQQLSHLLEELYARG
jgi:glycosyltransferase involved in cell wall biosynthesis